MTIPEVQCWHEECDENGICKSCGARARISFSQDEEFLKRHPMYQINRITGDIEKIDDDEKWEDKIYNIKIGMSQIGLSAIGDQIIVLEDKFRSGYECRTCDGEGYSNEDCDYCRGTGKETSMQGAESLCRICCPRNLVESGKYTPGKKVCPDCQGKGSFIIAPQISERKPSSGIIVSTGPSVHNDCRIINRVTGGRWEYPMKIGDRVLYSQFAGSAIYLKQKELIRILHAHEVLTKLHGSMKTGDFTR